MATIWKTLSFGDKWNFNLPLPLALGLILISRALLGNARELAVGNVILSMAFLTSLNADGEVAAFVYAGGTLVGVLAYFLDEKRLNQWASTVIGLKRLGIQDAR